ncbi:MAG: molybdopterin-binding protein [Rhodovibrionaceae bacterium]|nr:molybdopterin-binding protein [Rhodovibrionaceae bacterium]
MSDSSNSKVQITAAMLIIGNEILSGRTKDANLPYAGARLNEIGVRLAEARVVRDVEEEIVEAVNALRARHDYVFTSGGIGPTHDDITAASVARAFGVDLILNPDAHAVLRDHYGEERLTEARLRMAHTPEGARLIENPVSKAPGFRIENVYVMAGVPSIMQAMFDSVLPSLSGGKPLRSVSIGAALAEGDVARPLGAVQARYPEVEIGSYPYYGGDRPITNLVLRSTEEDRLELAAEEVRAMVRDLGVEPMDNPLRADDRR